MGALFVSMGRRRPVLLCAVLAWAFSGNVSGRAQEAPAASVAPAEGFVVTGRVVCADTQRPARFAQVTLIPATQPFTGDFGGRGQRRQARTDLEGNFTLANVPVGEYFVTGNLSGYVNQTGEVEAALNAAQTGGSTPGTSPAPAGVPMVHVSAGGATTALALERGGVIAGTVQWDDGSPAGGVQVNVQPATTAGVTDASATVPRRGFGNGFNGFFGFPGAQTDDRGRFRLTGLSSGTYLVRANVQAPAPGEPRGNRGFGRTLNLFVYAPNKMRRNEATPVTVAGADEHGDIAITLGIAALHTVSGSVASTGAAVRSGSISLTDQADSSLTRNISIGADGSFAIPYVPPGNYTLNVNASAQALASGVRGGTPPTGSTTRFQPLQESITVADSDLNGLTLNVAAANSVP